MYLILQILLLVVKINIGKAGKKKVEYYTMIEFISFNQVFNEIKNLRRYHLNYIKNEFLSRPIIILGVLLLIFLFCFFLLSFPSIDLEALRNLLIIFTFFSLLYLGAIPIALLYTFHDFREKWEMEFKKTLLRYIFEEMKNEKKIIISYYYETYSYNQDFYNEVINILSFAKEAIIKRIFIKKIKELITSSLSKDEKCWVSRLLVFNFNNKMVYWVEGAGIELVFYDLAPDDSVGVVGRVGISGILIICDIHFKSELLAVFYNTNDEFSYSDDYNKGKYIKYKYPNVEIFTFNPNFKFFNNKVEVLVDKLIKNYYFQNKFYGSFFVIKDNKLINFLSYEDLALVDIDGLFFVPSLLASDKILKKAVIHTYVQLDKRINFINEIIKIIGSGLEE